VIIVVVAVPSYALLISRLAPSDWQNLIARVRAMVSPGQG
jgi:hypothetical protein